MGTLPVAAYRYCAAVTEAARYGWYVLSPLEIQIVWDGSDFLWSFLDADAWHQLTTLQHPGFADLWDASAPDSLQGFAPPFLTATHHSGVLQMWTGLFVRTAPGWSLIVRSPVNLPLVGGYQLYEGIIETDEWFGPLFVNLRVTRTDYPILLGGGRPLFQIQPIPRVAYVNSSERFASQIESLAEFSPTEWEAFERIMDRKSATGGSIGGYATHVRRRGRSSR